MTPKEAKELVEEAAKAREKRARDWHANKRVNNSRQLVSASGRKEKNAAG